MNLPDPKDRPTLTVEEVAPIMRVSRGTAYEAVRSGAIPSIRLGRRLVVPTAALYRMLGMGGTFGYEERDRTIS